jgi:hypothetical protein
MNEIQKNVGKTSLLCLVLYLLWLGISEWTEPIRSKVELHAKAMTNQDRTLFSPLTNLEFEQCIKTLEDVSGNDREVGMDEFIQFLKMYSGPEMSFEDFQDLPSTFVLIFYTAACSFGDGCDTEEEPTISLGNLEDAGADGVLYMFCQSVKTVSALQLSMRFQFQIRHVGDDETSIEEILVDSDGIGVIQALEEITEEALLERFGCGEDSWTRARKTLQSERNLALFEEGRLVSAISHAQRRRQLEPFSSNQFGSIAKACDYDVKALVQAIRPFGESTVVSFPRTSFY